MKRIFSLFLRVLLVLLLIPLTGALTIFLNYHLIALAASGRLYEKPDDIHFRKYTLVMGAGSYKPEMWINHAFNHRMHTTAELFEKKKTEKIITSGIRISNDDDEVAQMKLVLRVYGIPETAIITDYGGFRTWSSVERVYKYYKFDNIIIISQRDQLERALFIAGCLGLDAIGVEAEPTPRRHRFWTIREYLARVKCTFECIAYKFNFSL
jgi:SanA protein